MSVFGIGASDPGKPQYAQLDPTAQGFLNEATNNAEHKSAADFAGSRMQNVGSYAGSLTGGQTAEQAGAATGSDPYFMKAARDYYGSKTSKKLGQQAQMNDMQKYTDKDNYIKQYMAAAHGQAMAAANSFAQATQAQMNSDRARAGLINSMFQTGQVAMGYAAAAPSAQSTQSVGTGDVAMGQGGARMGGMQAQEY